jgi:hypothetical protein
MTYVLVYWPDFRNHEAGRIRDDSDSSFRLHPSSLHWHSNHRVFNDLLPGDRLWVVTSGKSLGLEDESAGYVVAVWPVAQVVKNPGDDPQFPSRKYQHRVLVNEIEAIHLDQPVCVDHIIRREGYDERIPVGRFLRGPRRLTDGKVRQLRSAAGAEMAQKWLTASKRGNGTVAVETSEQQGQTP